MKNGPNMAGVGETVTVACRMPSGVILRIFEMVDETKVTSSGMQTSKVAREVQRVELNGSSPRNRQGPHFLNAAGLTQVSRHLWETWCAQNHDSDLLARRIVFTAGVEDDTNAAVREVESVLTGFEPLAVAGEGQPIPDARVKSVGRVTTAQR